MAFLEVDLGDGGSGWEEKWWGGYMRKYLHARQRHPMKIENS